MSQPSDIDAIMTSSLLNDELVLANSLFSMASHESIVEAARQMIKVNGAHRIPLLIGYNLTLSDILTPGMLNPIVITDDVESMMILHRWGLDLCDVIHLNLLTLAIVASSTRLLYLFKQWGLSPRHITTAHVSIALVNGDVYTLTFFLLLNVSPHVFRHVNTDDIIKAVEHGHRHALELFFTYTGDSPQFDIVMKQTMLPLIATQRYCLASLLLNFGKHFEAQRMERRQREIEDIVKGSRKCGICRQGLFTCRNNSTIDPVSIVLSPCKHLSHLACVKRSIEDANPVCSTCAFMIPDDSRDYTIIDIPSHTSPESVHSALLQILP